MSALLRPRLIYLADLPRLRRADGLRPVSAACAKGSSPARCASSSATRSCVTGVIALVAAIHDPRQSARWIYSALLVLSAGAGAVDRRTPVAGCSTIRPTCSTAGPISPICWTRFRSLQVLPKVFKGEGDCAKVTVEVPRPVHSRVGAGLVRRFHHRGRDRRGNAAPDALKSDPHRTGRPPPARGVSLRAEAAGWSGPARACRPSPCA